MANIVIVEDDVIIANQLKDYLSRYEVEQEEKFRIIYYNNPEIFLKEYSHETDLVFMDINMPQMNGMSAAKKLRKLDAMVSLVFVTYLAKYAINGYEVQALDFILKPLNYDTFKVKLDRIMRMIQKDEKKRIMVKSIDGVVAIAVQDISFVEIANHYLYFHIEQEIIKSRGTLKEAQEALKEEDFCLCNKCYLVNLSKIDAIRDNIVIVSQQELVISRLRKKEFMTRLGEYYRNRKVNIGKLS